MLKEEYFVNKDAGTVTCVLWSNKLAATEYVNNHFMQNNIKIYYAGYNFDERFCMPVKFTGIAKPMPTFPPLVLVIAAFIPITLPSISRSGPPLLPGLIAASVWM